MKRHRGLDVSLSEKAGAERLPSCDPGAVGTVGGSADVRGGEREAWGRCETTPRDPTDPRHGARIRAPEPWTSAPCQGAGTSQVGYEPCRAGGNAGRRRRRECGSWLSEHQCRAEARATPLQPVLRQGRPPASGHMCACTRTHTCTHMRTHTHMHVHPQSQSTGLLSLPPAGRSCPALRPLRPCSSPGAGPCLSQQSPHPVLAPCPLPPAPLGHGSRSESWSLFMNLPIPSPGRFHQTRRVGSGALTLFQAPRWGWTDITELALARNPSRGSYGVSPLPLGKTARKAPEMSGPQGC